MTYKLTQSWPQNLETGAFVNPETNPEYLAWLAEGNAPEPADPLPNPRIAEIYAELDANDRKYFRAVAEGDVARIAEWHNKQDALRDELKGLQ